MKVIILLLAMASASFASAASLECLNEGKVYSLDRLNDPYGDQFEDFWNNCQSAVFHGEICFNGNRGNAIDILSYLDDTDFLGDEYAINDIHYYGRKGISYEVYDGPNEWTSEENTIFRCD